MYFHEDEKDEKEEALKKLKDIMMGGMADRFGKGKKPIEASMIIEKEEPREERGMKEDLDDEFRRRGHDEEDEHEDEEEPTEEEKEEIERLYHKFCHGGKVR